MATGGAIIVEELMATGEAEVQSVQTTLDGGIVTSRDCRFAGSPLCLLAVWLARRDRRFACWPSSSLKLSLVSIFVASN